MSRDKMFLYSTGVAAICCNSVGAVVALLYAVHTCNLHHSILKASIEAAE